jgi:hypothetical protein
MKRILIVAGICLVPAVALAQDAATITPEQISGAYDWVCSNRSSIEPIIETIAGLGILSVPLHLVGIWMKKSSITKATPWLYKLFTIIRAMNGDVKPPPATIVQNASDVLQQSPSVVAQTGASPALLAAAAQVLKTDAAAKAA